MASDEASYRRVERRLWESFGLNPTEQRVHLQNLNVTVRVQEIGEGPPVVLIHGASVAGASWINLVKGLDGFRCIVLDRPGCGLSDPMPGAAGKADIDAVKRAADHLISDLLDALELPIAHVLGTSFGGFFALRGAAAAPGRVSRLGLYSWSMGVPMDHTAVVMRVAGIPGIGQVMARMPITRGAAKMMLRQIGLRDAIDSGKFNDEMLDWFMAVLRYTPTMLNEIRASPKVIQTDQGPQSGVAVHRRNARPSHQSGVLLLGRGRPERRSRDRQAVRGPAAALHPRTGTRRRPCPLDRRDRVGHLVHAGVSERLNGDAADRAAQWTLRRQVAESNRVSTCGSYRGQPKSASTPMIRLTTSYDT